MPCSPTAAGMPQLLRAQTDGQHRESVQLEVLDANLDSPLALQLQIRTVLGRHMMRPVIDHQLVIPPDADAENLTPESAALRQDSASSRGSFGDAKTTTFQSAAIS